ncbi:disease resistance protein RGA2-like [Abrus precatorius]|uniref:Disease resistance protein RGA2-like n=1 Tax=Abrus precatorius TaxID=3816 RepID=A0A8B8LPB7_ABRPR|nr:disease resistance protein RGA2-like [Abrus precatorius]
MAEALLGIVIDNLRSFVQEELATFWGVDQQIQSLSENLTLIRAVLKDAEEKQITSHAVKIWLQKLSDAAYVLDDILDEYSIEFNVLAGSNCATYSNPKKILSRYDVGKRMNDVSNRFDDIAKQRSRFELHEVIVENRSQDDEWRQTSSIITEPKVFGRDQDKEQIVEFLVSQASNCQELSICSIVGIGGLGKTTLAQLVFNDERVSKYFDLKIWVSVSDDFSTMKMLQSIVESVTGRNPKLLTLEAMQKKAQEVLQSKRYLLVLDDVWNEEQVKWDKFKCFLQCASETKGASVLVTTRLETVASIMGAHPTHRLQGLQENHIWSLFKQHAFGPSEKECEELVKIGKEIVRKCVGSPLAAKALGSLLRFKREENQWISIKESKLWNISDDNPNPIMSALRLSYFNLKLSLRRCFSFCAIFPKDFKMKKKNLIFLWMANGLISSRGNLEVERVGNEVWNELYQRSFFQEVKTDAFGYIEFKMHDLVHDLAQSIMGEECVASNGTSLTNCSSRVHHFSYFNPNKRINYNMIPLRKVESLRTFLDFCPLPSNVGFLSSSHTLRALRVGSFQPSSALKNLTHLRYLNLCNCDITSLPESICRLQKLQILELDNCFYLSSLPEQLTQLKDLRHLIIKGCKSLVAMPSKIGTLTCLKSLSVFVVDSKEGFGLAELHDLQLGGKLHIKCLEKVPSERDAKEANLIAKTELNRLFLSWGNDHANANANANAEQVLEALEPHTNLKSFGMNGYMGIQLPSWMRNTSNLKGLVDVMLFNCKNCQQLPPLGKLPCLTNLTVSGMNIKYIDDDPYDPMIEKAFTSLKRLSLIDLPNLEGMLSAKGVEMLPILSQLVISCVPKLALPCLPCVVYLQACVSNEELLNSITDYQSNSGTLQKMHPMEDLNIISFYKLNSLPNKLNNLSALHRLQILSCHELESLSEHVLQGLKSLRTLIIAQCRKFKSFSEGMRHLTCLENLEFGDCPQLMALPNSISQLTSLRRVRITGTNKDCTILEDLKRIPCLQNLILFRFPCLTSLPDWLGTITSLQKLEIEFCPELRLLPDSFQQLRNLQELRINNCPKLEKRCKKGTGEEWQKISHVPQFELDPEQTNCEKIMSKWKTWKQRKHRHRYYSSLSDEFSSKVDWF